MPPDLRIARIWMLRSDDLKPPPRELALATTFSDTLCRTRVAGIVLQNRFSSSCAHSLIPVHRLPRAGTRCPARPVL